MLNLASVQCVLFSLSYNILATADRLENSIPMLIFYLNSWITKSSFYMWGKFLKGSFTITTGKKIPADVIVNCMSLERGLCESHSPVGMKAFRAKQQLPTYIVWCISNQYMEREAEMEVGDAYKHRPLYCTTTKFTTLCVSRNKIYKI